MKQQWLRLFAWGIVGIVAWQAYRKYYVAGSVPAASAPSRVSLPSLANNQASAVAQATTNAPSFTNFSGGQSLVSG